MHLNFEFKARHPNIAEAEEIVKSLNSVFVGEDHQVDTYFNVPAGRLKLREGNIENALIFYQRSNTAAAKQSNVVVYRHNGDPTLKEALTKALGIKTVVDKKRRIYFVGNVKFHFDTVQHLGSFIEVEAIDANGDIGMEKLKKQCRKYQDLLNITGADFVAESYSDMLLAKKSSFE